MTLHDKFMIKMIVYLNMLAAIMENRIGSKIHGRNIITEELNRNLCRNTQVKKELAKPLNLSNGAGTSAILGLSGGARDSGLLLRASRGEIGAQ